MTELLPFRGPRRPAPLTRARPAVAAGSPAAPDTGGARRAVPAWASAGGAGLRRAGGDGAAVGVQDGPGDLLAGRAEPVPVAGDHLLLACRVQPRAAGLLP